ncbi:DsbA family protein [Uruburuella testudinis]|uniref:DsbA family protein n=1 Tax=Uruburuella testudinis TaxID=1282863 RepID=A0ABY4DZB4_9NEIS|nr:DsbA family protein [Uruburuella testudinis]UOO82932.1 DsbA family protein [Uruburuella testudinis]
MVNLTYLFDPLCGWCYGAAPAIRLLAAQADFHLRALPTGLFCQPGRTIDADFAAHARRNDQQIAALTGQVFSDAYRENVLGSNTGFDSTPMVDALTAVALHRPERELSALAAFQTARYVDGRDVTDADVLADILQALDLHEAAAIITRPATRVAAQTRISEGRACAQSLGLQGVPQLLVQPAGQHILPQALPGKLLFGDLAQLPAQIRQLV